MRSIRRHFSYANVAATAALCIALGGGAFAAARQALVGSDGVVHACVDSHGRLTVVRAGKRCRARQQPVALSERGLPGVAGAPGKQGVPGLQGVPGPSGSDATFSGAMAGGDLLGQYPNPTIAPGKVGSAAIAAGAVGTNQLAAGAVGTNQLAAGAVGTNQVAAGAVGTAQLADGSVTPQKWGLVPIYSASALDSTSPKTVVIDCPAGKVPVGGGGGITDGVSPLNGVAALSYDGPRFTLFGGDIAVSAYEPNATSTTWEITAYAYCASGT